MIDNAEIAWTNASGENFSAKLAEVELPKSTSVSLSGMEGIVADSVEDSISNLCSLASEGMVHTDHQIIRIMIGKAS